MSQIPSSTTASDKPLSLTTLQSRRGQGSRGAAGHHGVRQGGPREPHAAAGNRQFDASRAGDFVNRRLDRIGGHLQEFGLSEDAVADVQGSIRNTIEALDTEGLSQQEFGEAFRGAVENAFQEQV